MSPKVKDFRTNDVQTRHREKNQLRKRGEQANERKKNCS